jgi:hypothetical protein
MSVNPFLSVNFLNGIATSPVASAAGAERAENPANKVNATNEEQSCAFIKR